MSTNIPVLFSAAFDASATWSGGEAYASVTVGQATGSTPPAFGKGNPLNYVAIVDRTNPNSAPIFQGNAPNNTTAPSGLDQYLTDDYIMYWASAAFVNAMPQGALYTMLNANGGGRLLHQMETLSTVMACGVNAALVYLLATVPGGGTSGVEFLEQRSTSNSGGSNSTYVYKNNPYQLLLELVPAPNGMYTPLELN